MSQPILEVVDLRKTYSAAPALDGVSFQVSPGEMFGLLGPNGAGKTTLLSIICGLLAPSAGEVRIFGKPVGDTDKDARRQIGIAPQELALYGELTARENLEFFGQLYDSEPTRLQQRVQEVLRAVGLADHADGRVDGFSGGMKRRLNLGVALVHQPALLLLDEPTTGVDPQSRNHIFEEVRRVNAEGTTVVYTSHYMEEVQALCPRVGILDHGRLIIDDRMDALLRQMSGVIRIHVRHTTALLRERVMQTSGVRLTAFDSHLLELECQDVKGTLLRLLAILSELDVDLTSLETEEANLERVFLHLTGRALRD
jgi:ABC-2 type transport system ATP-binding protein